MRKHVDKSKQKELEKYLSSCEMDFDKLKQLISAGIKKKVKPTDKPISSYAFRKGLYLGCPGKDIYFALSWLDEDQFTEIAELLSQQYPDKAPGGHVHTAACIRYIYGCFDKQGCLLSKKHTQMLSNENWTRPEEFMTKVNHFFEKHNKSYGQVLYHEMKAHRLGDSAVIKKDPSLLEPMLDHYLASREIALKIKCWKQTFTPLYWAACYFEKFDKGKATHYHKKSIKNMERYCPDAREGYREKAIHSISYIKKHSDAKSWKKYRSMIKKCKNKCLVKIRNKF